MAQVRPPYAALSHCWGTSQPIRTLRSNVEAHMGRKPFLAPSSTLTPHVAECADNVAIRRRSSISSISSSLASSLTINSSTPSSPGIPVSSLPRTFRDAVTATRALGLRYLWIDSLCIVQDDPEDWAREAGRMAGVYGGAHVVIAANRAGGCEEGFLPPVPETSSMRTSPESPWSPRYPTSPRRLSRMNMAQRWLGSAGGRAVVGDDNGDADGVEMSDSRGPSRRFEGLIYIPWEGGEQGEDGNDESEVATPFVYRRVLHSHRHSVLRTPSSLSGSSGGIGGTPGQMLAEQASSEGPLARRAWAFQERLLARRFLAFGEHEMRFECVAGLRCECRGRPTELPGLHRHNLGFFLAERRDSLRQDWRSIIVPLYTRRRLTRWEDRLVAVSAVAEAWGRAMEQEEKSREAESGGQQGSHVESQYLAGLWRSDLVAGLAWYNVGSPMPYVTRSNDRKGTVAPSWSWASIHGMAEYVPTWDRPSGLGDALLLSSSSLGSQVSTGPSAPRLAEVVDVSYTLSRLSTNRYGDCESASVTLKGRFGQATARPVTRSQGECDAGGGRTGPVITGYELAFAGSSTFFGDRVSHWVVPRAGNWIRFDALMDVVDVRVEAEGAKDVFRIVRTAAQRRQAWQDVTFSLPREHTAAEETSSMTRLPGATELSGETALSDVTTLPGATLSGATLDGEYPVWCLCLESQSDWDNNGRHTFLILGHSKDKPHAYERLGIAILHDLSVEESEQVERFLEERTVVKTVSIV